MAWVLPVGAQLLAAGVPFVEGALEVPQALKRQRHKREQVLRSSLVGFILRSW